MMSEPGPEVIARFVAAENVEIARGEVLRQVAVYAGLPNASDAPATMKASVEGFASETDQS